MSEGEVELKNMSFKDHFSTQSHAYASYRPSYPPELVDVLAEASPDTSVVWDVGCGSGQLSTLLNRRFSAVLATDASRSQIEQAVAAERVSYLCRPAEDSGFHERSVDCIVVAQAAHWFDMPRFASECRRVGKPRALVALVTYGWAFIEPALDRLSNGFALETLTGFWPPERHHVDTGYRELEFPFEPVQLAAVTMRASWSVDQYLGYVGTWSAVAALRKAGRGEVFEAFAASYTATWTGQVKTVEWPLVIRAGRLPG